MQPRWTLYLAGPGVFRADWQAWGLRLQVLAQQHGWQALYPMDNQLPAESSPEALRQAIYRSNLAMIEACDALFADMRAFRSGAEPDSGTAFEVGYAAALGKPVILWLPDVIEGATMLSRVPHARDEQGTPRDPDGLAVEDFGAPLNLMLMGAAHCVIHASTPELALALLADWKAAR